MDPEVRTNESKSKVGTIDPEMARRDELSSTAESRDEVTSDSSSSTERRRRWNDLGRRRTKTRITKSAENESDVE